MLFIWILMTTKSSAYEMSSEDDGKNFGYFTLFGYIALWVLMLLIICFRLHHKGLHGSFTQTITYLQFARLTPLMDFKISGFYTEFYVRISYFFQS